MSQLSNARYQIIQVLSQDQVGENYIVTDIEDKSSTYYILKKIFIRSYNEQELNHDSNLFKEIKILQEIARKYDRVQKIFAYWEENQEFCLLKEFIRGNSLNNIIEQQVQQQKYLTEEEIVSVISSLLKTLIFIHSQGIIHRNIKPSNIIQRELDGEYVLIDFGSNEAAISYNIGISEYMPMEQFHGKTQFNSDIYALGIIAICMLTNLPASEITGINSPRNFITGEIRWRQRSPKVSRKLAHVINKMVKLDYRHRYKSALDALVDIRPLQNNYRGNANIERRSMQDAIKDYTKAIEINPEYALAYYNRGLVLTDLGKVTEAISDFEKAAQLFQDKGEENSYKDALARLQELRVKG